MLINEFGRLASSNALPARVEPDRSRLVVYGERWAAWLYPTNHGDAYQLGHVAPLSFKDQERLLKAALVLSGTRGWWAYHHVRDVPQRSSSHWPLLCRAWADLAVPRPGVTPPMPAHHVEYLDLLTEVIEATRDIEIARQRREPALPYRKLASTREERYSARGVYAFHLLRDATVGRGALVFVTDQPDLRGRVLRIKDREITVRFDDTVDYARIPQQGALQVLPSDRVYRAQLDAVETLREQRGTQPHLLTQLVDQRLAPYRPDSDAQPRETLDPAQLHAFRTALTVPDLLLVLGPPGTGKTRTITEIAAGCAERGQRVLVTSHTNRAVDNVLERLPPDVRAVRVGNEDTMTAQARGFMVETQVEALRQEILAATAGTASRLATFTGTDDQAGRWLGYLAARLAEAQGANRDVQFRTAELAAAVERAIAPFAAQLAAADQRARESRESVVPLAERHRHHERQAETARRRAASGVPAFFFRWLADRRERHLAAISEQLNAARTAMRLAEESYAAVRARADALVAADPGVRAITSARDGASKMYEKALGEATRAVEAAREVLRPAVAVPGGVPDDLAGWTRLYEELMSAAALARNRAGLLAQWREQVAVAEQDLHRELVRYADVVAATCIGTATTTLLAELEFDVAIVDEAGQISTPNLLVPLVRARRAVLVGDHNQLPPFLDDEVRSWADSIASDRPPEVATLVADVLRRSAFERLYPRLADTNRVMLRVQRRMPAELAQFVSNTFYRGLLETDHPGGPPDPVFSAPLAMIDTSDQPATRRREQPDRSVDGLGRPGYVNELEARLIVQLLGRNATRYADWAVIVPYRAQAELITQLLRRELGDAGVADNVGTVDSFQGGERDLIVYGFTRSNHGGQIGFLTELRRLNVAITRPRRQLVLVGDTTTLRAARDPGFAALIQSLIAHLDAVGDRRPSREIEGVLND
ncbi:AAA domain-containing protein [Micromonospora andamanensis]|uniref:AAA domain-containing protein n=1 Tax=Micromonospora andamanensis TaxID=1287068 RepID=UPI00194E2815|nr:AAA domain-containing protein [Micromonospora andamanensis]